MKVDTECKITIELDLKEAQALYKLLSAEADNERYPGSWELYQLLSGVIK